MERCRAAQERLAGRMPPEAVVAHETGTIGGTVNDVGVLISQRMPGESWDRFDPALAPAWQIATAPR